MTSTSFNGDLLNLNLQKNPKKLLYRSEKKPQQFFGGNFFKHFGHSFVHIHSSEASIKLSLSSWVVGKLPDCMQCSLSILVSV